MATEHPSLIVDRLVGDLEPVRPHRAWHGVALLAAVMLAELALILAMMPARPDLSSAMTGPMFWWKLVGCAGVAVAAAGALLVLVSPAARPGAGRRWLWLSLGGAVIAGAALWAAGAMPARLAETLDWRAGLHCVAIVEAYALPVWLAAFVVARRGAPARPRAAAVAAGLCGAAWGAAGFVWSCPHDDPLYVVTWYGLALLIGAGAGALVLTRWLRW
ncbi:NrsF family protein [Glacieibacterium frigidum]|uniref:DUF1109 domain-containing protein n=1 Tax=Glacieibacterium frigidum TaxID=2593303 RepID=A0A552UF94_9SPHN|nr:NrsF family protein [Glacieibacterium frigidum]TRW16892.1 DUF1109 domain-containing protein [Glacieibacterium frigidum]